MKLRFLFLPTCLAMFISSCTYVRYQPPAEKKAPLPEFNKIVLEVIKKYPTDGTHQYWCPKRGEGSYSGSTRDLYLCGKRVMTGEPQKRTYCCGLTLEVFLVSYEKWLEKHGGENASLISPDNWQRFQRLWFVENTNGPGPSASLEEFHLGHTIEPDMALPGDFVQLWRTPKEGKKVPTGHSVIFLNWVRDKADKIEGMHYWSTQEGTNGISERTEYFGLNGGIAVENTYFARVIPQAKILTTLKTKQP